MGFFARPNLDNDQFKQLTGTTLTLSGETQIAKTDGFKLTDGVGGFIPIIATGGTNFDVLTYCNGQITLKAGASGGTGVYSCASPTTCTVGGLACNTPIYGCDFGYILEKILVPTVSPTVVAPSLTYSLNPSTNLYEVGCTASITGCIQFSRGSNAPQYYGSSSFRSGLPNTHKYQKFDGTFCCCTPLSSLNSSYAMSRTITLGANTTWGSVCYDAGTVLYDSASGTTFIAPNPLPSGATAAQPQTVTGIYPWFWGVSGTTPTIGQSLINSINGCGCKCVNYSTGSITVDNFNVTGKYIWFAIPSTSTSKTCWQGANNPSNNGVIPGGLFPAAVTCAVNSPSCDSPTRWSGISYKFYVSTYATNINYGMTFCN